MILEFFIVIVFLALTLVGIGYYTGIGVLELGGYFFLFGVGLSLLNGMLAYHSGTITDYEYENYTLDQAVLTNCSCLISSTETFIYSDSDALGERTGGLFLSVISVFGFISYYFRRRRADYV